MSRNKIFNRLVWQIIPTLIVSIAAIAGVYFGIYGETYLVGVMVFLFVVFFGALFLGIIVLLVGTHFLSDIILNALVVQIPKHKNIWIGTSLIFTIACGALGIIWGLSVFQSTAEVTINLIKASIEYWIICFVISFFGWGLLFISLVTEFRSEIETRENDIKSLKAATNKIEKEFENTLARAEAAEAKAVQWEQQITQTKELPEYVDSSRIAELRVISSQQFDLTKLLELCAELNINYANGNLLVVPMLVRAIMDHVPPIFGYMKFIELANNYGGKTNSKSFKKSMNNLQNSLRSIADSRIHTQIRSKETLPNKIQVDFSSDLDVLLEEIVRVLK